MIKLLAIIMTGVLMGVVLSSGGIKLSQWEWYAAMATMLAHGFAVDMKE